MGIPEKPDNYDHSNVVNRLNSFGKRMGARLFVHLWDNSYSPFSVLRMGGKFGTGKFLNIYLRNRMTCLQLEEEI